MKKSSIIFLLIIAFNGYSQDDLTQTTIQGVLSYNQEQVVQLAEAFSEEQYDWRPMDGVNSVGEALMHVVSSSYYLALKLGFPPPENVDMTGLSKITGKDNILAALKQANAFVLEKVAMVKSEELKQEVDFGFTKMNRLAGLLTILEHNAEHKGQLIAYARSNDVIPPWSK